MIVCRTCNQEKNESDFYFRKDNQKHRTDCKCCVRKTRGRYRKENPEKVNAANRKSYNKKPEHYRSARKSRANTTFTQRAASANNRSMSFGTYEKLTYSEVRMVIENSGHACYHCGKLSENIQLDHIKPLSKGGSNRPHNIVVSCPRCNAMKGSSYDAEA